MWEIRTQYSIINDNGVSAELDWNAIVVDSEDDANHWWNSRVNSRSDIQRVYTMYKNNQLVKIRFS